MSRRETNPHFSRPQRPQHEDLHQQPPNQLVPPQEHHDQYPPIQPVPRQGHHGHFPPYAGAPTQQGLHYPQHEEDHLPLRPPPLDDLQQPRPISQVPRRGQQGQPSRGPGRKKKDKPYPDQPLPPSTSKHKVNFQEPSKSPKPLASPGQPPPEIPPEPLQDHSEPHKQPPYHGRHRHREDIKWPTRKKSNPCTWCGAVFCIIFWLVIIIGGLIVLIVYLVFRPQSPHFDVSSATLNAAYLDFGYLLNADFSILANFTNPNKKVHVDFSSVIIYLYYGSTLIATQYVEPFSAAKVQSRFAYIHMVTSQVQLPLAESQRLLKQMESNGVLLQVRGVFRARSKLGTILRYSYNLYGLCNIMVTRPPDGMMIKKKCRTKR